MASLRSRIRGGLTICEVEALPAAQFLTLRLVSSVATEDICVDLDGPGHAPPYLCVSRMKRFTIVVVSIILLIIGLSAYSIYWYIGKDNVPKEVQEMVWTMEMNECTKTLSKYCIVEVTYDGDKAMVIGTSSYWWQKDGYYTVRLTMAKIKGPSGSHYILVDSPVVGSGKRSNPIKEWIGDKYESWFNAKRPSWLEVDYSREDFFRKMLGTP